MMKIVTSNGKIMVTTEYSSEFVYKAKQLGGKWNSDKRTWDFVADKLELVKAALVEVYGTDGDVVSETVTVEIDMDEIDLKEMDAIQNFEMFGRVLLSRPNRDSNVKIHTTVAVIEGGFNSSGGSVRNPQINAWSGTIVRVFNVPRNLAEKATEETSGVKIIDSRIDLAALETEREKLLKRLKEIDALLLNKSA